MHSYSSALEKDRIPADLFWKTLNNYKKMDAGEDSGSTESLDSSVSTHDGDNEEGPTRTRGTAILKTKVADDNNNMKNKHKKKLTKQFVSDVEMDMHYVSWKIKRFSMLLKRDRWITSRFCEFEAGSIPKQNGGSSASRQPLKWRLNLESNREDEVNRKWIGISLQLLTKENVDLEDINAECTVNVEYKGFIYCDFCDETFNGYKDCPNCNKDVEKQFISKTFGSFDTVSFKTKVTCPQLIQRSSIDSYVGTLNDGDDNDCLTIDVSLKLFAVPNQPATVCSELTEAHLKEFEVSAGAKTQQDLKKLLENKVPCVDVKIITEDKQEFVAQWGILAARSSFFENMYHSKMKESQTGIIDLPDISGKSFEVLRNFIYTGGLLESWKENEVIPELVNAAAKYMLSDLLKFLDNALGDLCNSQNAVQLLLLAQKYSLKNAEEDILDWIKENGTNTADSFLTLWNNLTNKTGNNEGSRISVKSVNENNNDIDDLYS